MLSSEGSAEELASPVPSPSTIAHMVGESLLASDADAIIAADRDGRITFWSPGAERIFGYSTAAALGASLDIIIPQRQRERHWEGYRRVTSTGVSRYAAGDILAVPAMRKDGSGLSLEFTVTPMRDRNDGIAGLVAVLRDVTKRFQEVKELRHKLSSLVGPMPPSP
jgi:PAS domain S-box-containing protein